MTQTTSRIAELRSELEQIAAANGCELVHVELKGGTLRLILDKPDGGVTLADCEVVSKQSSAYLDVADFGKSRYVLEVSSPGLDRELYKPADVERFLGKLARVAFTDPDGKKKTVIGRLQELQRGEADGDSKVVVTDDKSGERTEVPWKDIRNARLEIEL